MSLISRPIFRQDIGSSVIFNLTDKGVHFLFCEIITRETYSQEERGKIEHLVAERDEIYKTAEGARKHLKSL